MKPYPRVPAEGEVGLWIDAHLPRASLLSIASELPKSVRTLVELAVFLADPDRIVLFGSRARGQGRPTSDFDLWFEGIRDERGFSRLEDDARNEFITLYPTNLVDARDAGPSLAAEVAAEGKCLYERPVPFGGELPSRPGPA